MELNESNFESTIAKGVSLVDFYATWCGPCNMMAPTIEKLALEFAGRAVVAKVNTEENQNISSNISALPTVIIYKDGNPVETMIGLKSEKTLREAIEKHIV